MDKIFAVVVHYNSDKDTKACLDSLANIEQKGFRLQTLIIDNGSKKPLTLTKDRQKQGFEVLRSETNLGFTGGSNLGMRIALERGADYVFWLNNDTEIDKNCLWQLHQFLRKDITIGAVAPKIYFYPNREFHPGYSPAERGKVIWFGGGSIDWQHLAAFHRRVDEVDIGHFVAPEESDFLSGCALLLPKQVIEQVGWLDESYFLYLEDVDYSLRIKAAGFKLVTYPPAILWHKNAGSSGGAGSPLHTYYQTRNRLLFGWRYGNKKAKLTIVRLAWQVLLTGSQPARKAVYDLITGNLGKQQLV